MELITLGGVELNHRISQGNTLHFQALNGKLRSLDLV